MPAIANIVVADATPTNHTLIPQQAALALSTWMAKEAATYEGNPRAALQMSPPSKVRPTSRVKVTLAIPFERTVDAVVTVPDTITFFVDAVIPSSCSDAEAEKAYVMFKNLMAHATVEAYLADREAVY